MSLITYLKGPPYPERKEAEDREALQERRLDWLRMKSSRIEVLVWALLAFHGLIYGDMQGVLP